ncbi:DJ-1 family protein, partial [Klebsiella pneumoniae]|nr:DJ-1 family protein [Klebsiella pneumoniae]
ETAAKVAAELVLPPGIWDYQDTPYRTLVDQG